MAIVIDGNLLKGIGACHGYKLPSGENLLWAKGCIGILDSSQERLCVNPEIQSIEIKPELQKRLKMMSAIGKITDEEQLEKIYTLLKEQ